MDVVLTHFGVIRPRTEPLTLAVQKLNHCDIVNMKPTDQTLKEQLRLTEREITRRKEAFSLDEKDIAALVSVKAFMASELEAIIEEFYEHQVAIQEVSQLIGDADTLLRLKRSMKGYIMSLFAGQYDAEYVQGRLRIGMVHKRIGVSPKLYVSAFQKLLSMLRQRLMAQAKKDCGTCSHSVSALEKIMMFDLVLVFDTYISSLMTEVSRKNQEIEDYAETLEVEIAKQTRKLSEMASRDGLTGLINQRVFYEKLRYEISRSTRLSQTLSLVYFDLDGFKAVNDIKGHQEGDNILIATASALNAVIRDTDIAARYGGDEFCVILPATGKEETLAMVNRLIASFEEKMAGSAVTLSVGVVTVAPGEGKSADELVKMADGAMYNAKKRKGHAVESGQ
jgi:diguanylate cyclase (GGDEF)-like protein